MSMKIIVSLIPALLLLQSCGGGSDTSTTGSTSTTTNSALTTGTVSNTGAQSNTNTEVSTNSPPSPSQTQALSSYISAQHNSARNSFQTAEASLSSTLSAQGKYRSGEHYSRSADSYVNLVQNFLNSAVAQTLSVNAQQPVDLLSILNLLRSYQNDDINYAISYYNSVNWGLSGASLAGFINETKTKINSAYDSATASLR
jgi:hypothetical protein